MRQWPRFGAWRSARGSLGPELTGALHISSPHLHYCFDTPPGHYAKQKARVREYITATAPLRIAEAQKILAEL
jgi:hypothetical protein